MRFIKYWHSGYFAIKYHICLFIVKTSVDFSTSKFMNNSLKYVLEYEDKHYNIGLKNGRENEKNNTRKVL